MLEHYIRAYNDAIYDTDREAALGGIHGAVGFYLMFKFL